MMIDICELFGNMCICDCIKLLLLVLFFILVITVIVRTLRISKIERKINKIIHSNYSPKSNT